MGSSISDGPIVTGKSAMLSSDDIMIAQRKQILSGSKGGAMFFA